MSCEDEHHDHNHGHLHVPPIATNQSQSLLQKIDTVHVSALNMSNPREDLAKIFRKQEDKYKLKPAIESDADCQLIIHIPFVNASVKLYSVTLRTAGGDACPKTIQLFKNDKLVDFDNVEQKKPSFQFEHPHIGILEDGDEVISDSEFIEHHVPRHVFTGVLHLTLFVKNAWEDDDDPTKIHYIELRGEFTELSKDPVITLNESAANPADHVKLGTEITGMHHV